MPLINQPGMTERNLEAHRANAHQSSVATTPAGKERARDAAMKHGCCSRQREISRLINLLMKAKQPEAAHGEEPEAIGAQEASKGKK